MSKLSKLSFLFSGISFVCLILGRLALGGWNHFLWVPLGFFLILLIVPLVKEAHTLVDFFKMKTTKRGMSMGSMILLVLVGLVMVNVIAVRKYRTWDFSAARVNTLSPQSIQLIKSLKSDLKATFFYKNGAEGNQENRQAFRELIKKYQDQSDRIFLDFVEVDERPDLATEYGVNKGSGVVFLEYQGRRNRIEKIDEQEITGALLKVTREKNKIIYFVTGHGELDLEDARDPGGLNSLKMLLENNRYEVRTLTLSLAPKVPDDADVVAIVGPRQSLTVQALEALDDYLKKGGSLFVSVKTQQDGGMSAFLERWGIAIDHNFVFNVVETPMGRGLQQGATIAPHFSSEHEVTKVFGRNEFIMMRTPTSLSRGKIPPGATVTELVKAQEGSMAFKSLNISGEGPVGTYAVVMSAKGKESEGGGGQSYRLIVAGDSEFLSNGLLFQNLNRDLILNSMASLAREENMISVTPKEPEITKMNLTESGMSLFVWAFAIPLPLLMLALSIGLWTRRRFA